MNDQEAAAARVQSANAVAGPGLTDMLGAAEQSAARPRSDFAARSRVGPLR
jgi:hypothetical protein